MNITISNTQKQDTLTLLLTATLHPSQKIIGKNKAELDFIHREKEYLRALCYYITDSNFVNIVFCDNSNTYLEEFDHIKSLAKKFGKKIEFLMFQ
ncbi:MAG: hypothetical protein LBD75_03780 [Candidatus Peribacteria bacterium]|nr:hypothetical protein [Candidatus Peribacteria bacterium]